MAELIRIAGELHKYLTPLRASSNEYNDIMKFPNRTVLSLYLKFCLFAGQRCVYEYFHLEGFKIFAV
jgi:hypothetical protein